MAASSNYALTYTGDNVTIGTRSLSVTANPQTMIYGNSVPTLTYASGGLGLVNGDSLSGTLATTASSTASVGSYGITQGTLTNSNYAISYTGANLGVTQRPITITANAGQIKIYGNTDPTLTYTLEANSTGRGQVGADTFSGALSRAVGETVAGGPYAINAGTLANGNYSISFTPANFAITPRSLTLSAMGTVSKTYDGNTGVAVLPAPTFGNAISADLANLSLTGGTGNYADRNVGTGKAVSYSGFALSGSAAGNYSLGSSTASGTGTITQLASVNWTGATSNDWWTATNWAGGALPDNNNVTAVIIPVSASITSPVALNLGNTAVTANGSSFSLDVTGGFTSGTGAISVPTGSFSLATHSPITIGSGGVSAGTGLTLTATTANTASTITLNGPLSTTSGSATLTAYGNIAQNANITAPTVGVTSTAGNITIANTAITSASGITYSAVLGSIGSNPANFSGSIPTLSASLLIDTTPVSAPPTTVVEPAVAPVEQLMSNTLTLASELAAPTDPSVLDAPASSTADAGATALSPLIPPVLEASSSLTEMPSTTLVGGTIGGSGGEFAGMTSTITTEQTTDTQNDVQNSTALKRTGSAQARPQQCS